LPPAIAIAAAIELNSSGVWPVAAASFIVVSPSSAIERANSMTRLTVSATKAAPCAAAIPLRPPTRPATGATAPSIAWLIPLSPVAALSLAALWSRNAAVRPVTSPLARLNCPATCSSWPRSTPEASLPERMLLANVRVSAPNARRSACASANCARRSEVSAVTETERLSATMC
jgi:hypothetical protein